MMESIILAVVAGAVIGLVARFVVPGKQGVGVITTVLIGALGGLIGSVVANQFGYHNANGGIAWIPFFIGVAVAIVLVLIYESVFVSEATLGRRRDADVVGRRGRVLGRRNRLL